MSRRRRVLVVTWELQPDSGWGRYSLGLVRGLLERDFEHLLFAHGEPLVGGGKSALRDFVAKPVGEPDFGATA